MFGRGRHIVSIDDDAKDLLAVQKTLQGNTDAFSDIVDRYTKVLYSLALRTLGDREEAEDAVQDILLKVFHSLKSFKIGSRFYSWLYTIAINTMKSRMRKRRRGGHVVSLDIENPPQLPDKRVDVELYTISKFEEERAERALEILSPDYRIVFALRFLEGMPLKQISEILRVPVGTVKARIHRARKKLIDVLR